jgi:crossover junction endodeoxyribonuclease RuvC
MKVVGIDPGLSSTGIGIVQGIGLKVDKFSYGSIDTSKNTPLPGRLDDIYSKLLSLLKSEQPDLLVIEDVFSMKKYPRSGITLGQVSGIILLAGFRADVQAVQIPVREAKQVLTGNGNASKKQLEKAVRNQLKLANPIRPDHASDALGLALIGLYRHGNELNRIQA